METPPAPSNDENNNDILHSIVKLDNMDDNVLQIKQEDGMFQHDEVVGDVPSSSGGGPGEPTTSEDNNNNTPSNTNSNNVAKAEEHDKPDGTITARSNAKDDCSDLTDNNNDQEEQAPKSFPQKLMEILSDETHSDIISWLPHGTGFTIHKKKTFAAEILPGFFKASKFTSFTRKLNRWGFTRVPRGPETGAYFHKLFRRDKPELCLQMTSNSGNKYQANPMQQSLLPNMPGMMAPGMPPPMFPFAMNPMMATNMSPQQQQAMWQQQMQQMMMYQQQQMMQLQQQQQPGGGMPMGMVHPGQSQMMPMQPQQQQQQMMSNKSPEHDMSGLMGGGGKDDDIGLGDDGQHKVDDADDV